MHSKARAYDLAVLRTLGVKNKRGKQIAPIQVTKESPLRWSVDRDDEVEKKLRDELEKHYKNNPPKDRPCDWCGEPILKPNAEGSVYIHSACAEKERQHWMDILY